MDDFINIVKMNIKFFSMSEIKDGEYLFLEWLLTHHQHTWFNLRKKEVTSITVYLRAKNVLWKLGI